MNISRKLSVSAFITLLSVVLLIFFRTVPVSQIWKDYKIVYVKSNQLSEQNILSVLQKNGCSQIISSVNQAIPVFSNLAPVQVQGNNSWLYSRNGFFTDYTKSYSVFYVPDNQKRQLEKSLNELNCYGETSAFTDGASGFPWLCSILVLVFALFLLYFCDKKIYFLIAGSVLVLFAFSRPLYTTCGGAALALFADFLAIKLWGRKDFLYDFKNGKTLLPLILVPLFLLVISSPANAVLYVIAFAAGWTGIIVYDEAKLLINQINNRDEFKFVYIKKSSSVTIVNKDNILLLAGLVVLMFFFIFMFKTLSFISESAFDENRPDLPSPVSSAEHNLPDLTDFMDWSWITASFPYRKLDSMSFNITPDFGESVFVTDYEDVNGKITPSVHKVLTYNSSFVNSIYDKVEKLNYPALEKLMLKQGKNTSYGYSKKAGASTEKAGALILAVFAMVPCLLCLLFFTGKLKNGFDI